CPHQRAGEREVPHEEDGQPRAARRFERLEHFPEDGPPAALQLAQNAHLHVVHDERQPASAADILERTWNFNGMVHGVNGSKNRKALTWPSSLSTQMRPPCASTTILQKVRPRPVDIFRPAFRVSTCPNFSKIRSNASAGMPSPVSATEKSTASSVS